MHDVVETALGRFWLEDGILRFVANAGTEQSGEDAAEAMRVFEKLAGGQRRPAVIVVVGLKKLSREARTIYGSPEAAKTFRAVGLVVGGSAIARALINFMVTVVRPVTPTRMFDTVDEAVAWARTHQGAD